MSRLKQTLNRSHQNIDFAVWCESCQDWKTEFRIDESGLWILCNDCDDGLLKVIIREKKKINKDIKYFYPYEIGNMDKKLRISVAKALMEI